MIELKPCPFCGKEVDLRHYMCDDDNWWYIVCKNCDIAIDPWMWNTNRTKDEAIIKWNKRVN